MVETYSQKIQRAVNHSIPIYTHLELTYRCDQRCIHCYATIKKNSRKELSTNQYKKILDELADLGTLYLAITGGEIFMREDFFEIAHYARKKSFALRLFTNGISVNEKTARQIAELKPLRIEVSLYSITPGIHDQITQIPGSHTKTINAIMTMLKFRLKVVVKVPVMRQNLGEVLQIRDFAREIGAEFLSNPTIVPRGDGSTDNLKYRLTDEQLDYYFKEINNEWYFKTPSPDQTLCGAGKGIMAISPYGEVYPCVQMDVQIGDLTKQSLKDIWYNSQELKKIRELKLSKLDQCAACSNISYCNPCPGLALAENGSISAPASEACRQAQSRKRVFGKITNKQKQPEYSISGDDCVI